MKNNKALDIQVGGSHYKSAYQPIEWMELLNMNASIAFVAKYMFRHKKKNKKQDLEKALHCCSLQQALGCKFYQCDNKTATRETYKFIEANEQLDENQIKAFVSIANKDIIGLRESIQKEISTFYDKKFGC